MPPFVMRKLGDRRYERLYLEPGVYPHVNGDYIEVFETIVANRVEKLEKKRVSTPTGFRSELDNQAVWYLVGYEIVGEVWRVDLPPKKAWWRRILDRVKRQPENDQRLLPEAKASQH